MLYNKISTSLNDGRKLISILIDPGKQINSDLNKTVELATQNKIDFFLIGGSLVHEPLDKTIESIKSISDIPVYIFPGNLLQITDKADGIFLLSLISGRNPELLIGNHVSAAFRLKTAQLEIIPTGYILIENGKSTSVSYMSNTTPIPNDKPEITAATAIAGEMVGLKQIYLEAGSGAVNPVSASTISIVKKEISIPLIVGGGIKNINQLNNICKAGADIVVIGNSVEKHNDLIKPFTELVHSF